MWARNIITFGLLVAPVVGLAEHPRDYDYYNEITSITGAGASEAKHESGPAVNAEPVPVTGSVSESASGARSAQDLDLELINLFSKGSTGAPDAQTNKPSTAKPASVTVKQEKTDVSAPAAKAPASKKQVISPVDKARLGEMLSPRSVDELFGAAPKERESATATTATTASDRDNAQPATRQAVTPVEKARVGEMLAPRNVDELFGAKRQDQNSDTAATEVARETAASPKRRAATVTVVRRGTGVPVRGGAADDTIREVVELVELERSGNAGIAKPFALPDRKLSAGTALEEKHGAPSEYELLGMETEGAARAGARSDDGLEPEVHALDVGADTVTQNQSAVISARPQGQEEIGEIVDLVSGKSRTREAPVSKRAPSPASSRNTKVTKPKTVKATKATQTSKVVAAPARRQDRSVAAGADLAKSGGEAARADSLSRVTVDAIPAPKFKISRNKKTDAPKGLYVFGPTKPGSKLEDIADSLIPADDISLNQMMWAMYVQNPGAFINGDIWRLRDSYLLNVPNLEDLYRIGTVEADEQMSRMRSKSNVSNRL